MEKEREALRFEVNKAGAQIKEADAAIAAQKAEIEKLNLIIGEADQVGCIAENGPSCSHSPENLGRHSWAAWQESGGQGSCFMCNRARQWEA